MNIASIALLFLSLAWAESLSITKKNFQGQKWLFEEGWEVIASPVKAWDTAVKNNESSKEAFRKAIGKINPSEETTKERLESASKTSKSISKTASENTKAIYAEARRIEKKAFKDSSEDFKKSWETLSLGYVHLGRRNADDLESLKKVNTEFFGRIGDDFHSIEEGIKPVLGFLLDKESGNGTKYFERGKHAFQKNYEKSGKRGNSLTGLWDVIVGYASWGYHAIFSPAKAIPYYTTEVVLKTFVVTHHTVHSLGSNLYYSTKLGYRVVSPTVESGLLASLALLEGVHGSVTPNVFRSAGLINKVAVKSAAPVIGAGKFAIEESSTRAQNAGTYIVHGAEAVGEVVMEKVESGVVLGYSGLSQIPPQLLLTAVNSAVFLVYDGPNLMIAKVTGKVGDTSIEEIPTGSVMNVELMKKFGFKVEKLTDDPEILKKVLEHAD